MEKRLPLALFLSFLVLFGWMLMTSEPPEEGGGASANEARAEETTTAVPETIEPAGTTPSLVDDVERTFELSIGTPPEKGSFHAVFSNRGARLETLLAGSYYRTTGLDETERELEENWLPIVEPVSTVDGPSGSLLISTSVSAEELAPEGLDDVLWVGEELPDGTGVRFQYGSGAGVRFVKTIRFVPGTWHIELGFEIENESAGAGRPAQLLLTPAGCMPPELGDSFYPEPSAVAIVLSPKDKELVLDSVSAVGTDSPGTLAVPLPVVPAGIHNKYFAFLVREADDAPQKNTLAGAFYRPLVPEDVSDPTEHIVTAVLLDVRLPEVGEKSSYEYTIYAGPKDPAPFVDDFEPHELILEEDLGWFSMIGSMLLVILRFFHSLLGNWGVAIILLTLCVRAALFPLNRRSQTAMARYQKKMKRVQPKLEEIKKRFANDPQKQREAQARIMQEEGAFPPLGGCLPIFLQLPIFFGLFSALRTSFALRQAPFAGWITDLSRPDRLMRLDLELPLFLPDIEYLNILPPLMVVVWILQQRGMPAPADEQAARMQKMMMFMPVVFGVFLYNYAAGLSLYMMTTSTLGIFEQRVIKKMWPIDDQEQAPKTKKKKGCAPLAGAMQNMADKQQAQMKRMEAMKAEQRRQTAKKKKRKR